MKISNRSFSKAVLKNTNINSAKYTDTAAIPICWNETRLLSTIGPHSRDDDEPSKVPKKVLEEHRHTENSGKNNENILDKTKNLLQG